MATSTEQLKNILAQAQNLVEAYQKLEEKYSILEKKHQETLKEVENQIKLNEELHSERKLYKLAHQNKLPNEQLMEKINIYIQEIDKHIQLLS